MRKVISACLSFVLCLSAVTGYAEISAKETEQTDIVIENDGKILENGVDYYLTYRDNINVGTATLVVNFIGNYSGMQERTFNIVRPKSSGGGGGSSVRATPKPTATPEPTPVPTIIPTEAPEEKTEHTAYIEGYNGLFRPENDMTRAEAATIFARLVSERKNKDITGYSSFKDVNNSDWYAEYIAYLKRYDIISGYDDSTFKPNNSITRAEFTAVCTRFYELFDDISVSGRNVFRDVSDSYWAASYICADCGMEWIEGYDDGTFRPDNDITRAEVVAIVNRVLNRMPDKKYINENLSIIKMFTDVPQTHWAFDNIVEPNTTHIVQKTIEGENWAK